MPPVTAATGAAASGAGGAASGAAKGAASTVGKGANGTAKGTGFSGGKDGSRLPEINRQNAMSNLRSRETNATNDDPESEESSDSMNY